jgi:hypothetical protein
VTRALPTGRGCSSPRHRTVVGACMVKPTRTASLLRRHAPKSPNSPPHQTLSAAPCIPMVAPAGRPYSAIDRFPQRHQGRRTRGDRGIRLESRSACVTHPHLTADPGATDIDSLAGPAVTRVKILEQMQHMLGAQEGPVSQQSVVFLRQSAPATDGDQPRITLLREDRHTPGPTIHESTSRRAA